MQSRLENSKDLRKDDASRLDYLSLWLLICGAIAISLGGIFIRFSEESLSPDATIFNRFFIASLILISIRMPLIGAKIKSIKVELFNSKAHFWA